MIFNTHYSYIGGGGGKLNFEYTGEYLEVSDSKGWRVKFLTSGTLTLKSKATVDVFLVGAGGGSSGNSGAGGGYTKTVTKLELEAGNYPIVVGSGSPGADGGATSAFSQTANGGKSGKDFAAGDGSSGGGSYRTNASAPFYPAGAGGSDGSNGGGYYQYPGGTGQGTTTREFGESDGELYGGGGGGSYPSSGGVGASGGAGGGGNGRNGNTPAEDGKANTGGGAGGGSGANTSGGSGIVVVRVSK